ncbi:predicted protein [Postia placenta Mad-698-R]|uniref:Thioester reductase (TE) domain-containing protein n=1 Tax=Postia placenta MAD-698-R-SB12 TaxID=670580 RepID=A0A1X6MYT4_9APHY|nr:hypothetical protein POSPLADRAFT_1034083 [Postia placenta MAD-698-R-SB12]EED83358.1 predicted protein [Postia placenta Mad-698-R]OSX61402.1 hypothetical protein POSPLADRAFT_1034083 [Postia placenta MAD-698-R-SB12]
MASSHGDTISNMKAMLASLSSAVPSQRRMPPAGLPARGGNVVLVTGTTGSLGCHLLGALARSSDVLHVYALNRASNNASLSTRQQDALVERAIDPCILDLPKITLLEGDLSLPNWGIAKDKYREMYGSVTHILHNGSHSWRVDMMSGLDAFGPVLLGLLRLVQFALDSPCADTRRLLFISSTGAIHEAPRDMPIAEAPVDPIYAIGNGYAQSKWVAEQLLLTTAQRTTLDPLIVRVGQLTGGPAGDWAANEWFPVMVQSAPYLGCFVDDPRRFGSTDFGTRYQPCPFLPFDIAANALLDMLHASSPTHIVHLIHPRPVCWNVIARHIAKEFSVKLVPYRKWLALLENAARLLPKDTAARRRKMGQCRALRLLPFFRIYVHDGSEVSPLAMGWPNLEVKEAVAASQTLADPRLRKLESEDVMKWLEYWRRVGALPAGSSVARL